MKFCAPHHASLFVFAAVIPAASSQITTTELEVKGHASLMTTMIDQDTYHMGPTPPVALLSTITNETSLSKSFVTDLGDEMFFDLEFHNDGVNETQLEFNIGMDPADERDDDKHHWGEFRAQIFSHVTFHAQVDSVVTIEWEFGYRGLARIMNRIYFYSVYPDLIGTAGDWPAWGGSYVGSLSIPISAGTEYTVDTRFSPNGGINANRGGRILGTVNYKLEPIRESSGSGDPHFKTWTGKKFDYHGECDLVLLDHPEFDNGLGMHVHIRTTRINYFSYIEQIALQIGDDVLEFNNDVENVLLNGALAAPKEGKRKTFLADKYEVVRFKKAVLVKIDRENDAKIEFHARKIGFPSVKLRAGKTSVFAGSLGLLGQYSTGKQVARDGATEMNDEDATAYALEWQVRDTDPMLFTIARAPQFPTTCTPPKKMMGNRLGISHMKADAEKACAAWKEDMDDCIFDVLASRDIASAEEVGTLEEY